MESYEEWTKYRNSMIESIIVNYESPRFKADIESFEGDQLNIFGILSQGVGVNSDRKEESFAD
jgi:hypothetical protein